MLRQLVWFTIMIFPLFSNAQSLIPNTCDSLVLNQKELEKCRLDSFQTASIILCANFITSLKTEVLPKYRLQRRQLRLPENIEIKVIELRDLYDSVMNHKLQKFQIDFDKNQYRVQPKSYIVSSILWSVFRFYPDVYAMLLNPVHVNLLPKTSAENLEAYFIKCEELIAVLPPDLAVRLKAITGQLMRDFKALNGNFKFFTFQGDIEESARANYAVLNFLIWNS